MTKVANDLQDVLIPSAVGAIAVAAFTALSGLGTLAVYLGAAVAVPLVGLWADRRGRRREHPDST